MISFYFLTDEQKKDKKGKSFENRK
jgi:hypothetical protein